MNTLTPEQIQELRELHAKATQGPWFVRAIPPPSFHDPGIRSVAKVHDDASVFVESHYRTKRRDEFKSGANLIAAMHNSLPALLSAAERVQVLEELMREVCEWSFGREDETANEAFERYGELFYRDTGMLRPGKSDRSGTPEEDRRNAWNEWIGKRKSALESKVRAALTSTGDKINGN